MSSKGGGLAGNIRTLIMGKRQATLDADPLYQKYSGKSAPKKKKSRSSGKPVRNRGMLWARAQGKQTKLA